MSTFGNKLHELRIREKWTQDELAKRLGLSRSTIGMYETGEREANFETMEAIADIFNVDINILYGRPATPLLLSLEAQRIGVAYQKAPQRDQRTVDHVLEPYMDSTTAYVCFSISEQAAAAGTGIYLGPEEFGIYDVDASKLPEGAAFGVPICGDSMEPLYHDGDIAIIGEEQAGIGQIGLFTMDGMGYIKKLGDGVLESLNAHYDPISMREGIICNGRVVGKITRDDVRK